MNRRTAALAIGSVVGRIAWGQDSLVLPMERAFGISARKISTHTVVVDFAIAPGCILYRDKFGFSADDQRVKLVNAVFPAPLVKYDKVFEKNVGYYSDQVSIRFDLKGEAVPFRLTVAAQGCAVEQGVCYPPITKDFQVPASSQKAGQS